jgi:hypothetical protein
VRRCPWISVCGVVLSSLGALKCEDDKEDISRIWSEVRRSSGPLHYSTVGNTGARCRLNFISADVSVKEISQTQWDYSRRLKKPCIG